MCRFRMTGWRRQIPSTEVTLKHRCRHRSDVSRHPQRPSRKGGANALPLCKSFMWVLSHPKVPLPLTIDYLPSLMPRAQQLQIQDTCPVRFTTWRGARDIIPTWATGYSLIWITLKWRERLMRCIPTCFPSGEDLTTRRYRIFPPETLATFNGWSLTATGIFADPTTTKTGGRESYTWSYLKENGRTTSPCHYPSQMGIVTPMMNLLNILTL